MMNNLYEINGAIMQLTESFADGEIDEQAYLDTIESMGADTAVEDVVKSILNLESQAEAIKLEENRLVTKRRTAERTADRLREILGQYMDITNETKIKAGVFSVSRGSTMSVELMNDDVESYPEKYLVQQKPKLDKRQMLADLKNGESIDGAVIRVTSHIKIK